MQILPNLDWDWEDPCGLPWLHLAWELLWVLIISKTSNTKYNFTYLVLFIFVSVKLPSLEKGKSAVEWSHSTSLISSSFQEKQVLDRRPFSVSHILERNIVHQCTAYLSVFTQCSDLLRYWNNILTFSCTVMTSHSSSSSERMKRRTSVSCSLLQLQAEATGQTPPTWT